MLDIDLRAFGGSALTGDLEVPKDTPLDRDRRRDPRRPTSPPGTPSSSPSPWAGPRCSAATDIFIGANALDYSGYPDCRPEYIAAFEPMANLGHPGRRRGRPRLTIHTPLIALSKAEIIEQGLALGVDYRDHPHLLRSRRRTARPAAAATPACSG